MKDIQLVAPNGLNIVGYVTSDGDVLPVTCKFQTAGGQDHFFYELSPEKYDLDVNQGNDIILVDSEGNRWTGSDVQQSTIEHGGV